MKRKRIVVMGFMGSMPIAWRHLAAHPLHRRPAAARARCLLHRRLRPAPLQPANLRDEQRLRLRRAKSSASWRASSASSGAGVSARAICPDNPTAGLRLTKIRQLYREADAILNVCGTQEFNDDLLHERSHSLRRKRSRASNRSRSIKASGRRIDYLESIAPFSPLAKTSGPIDFPCRCTN